jgi:hypothetical protein
LLTICDIFGLVSLKLWVTMTIDNPYIGPRSFSRAEQDRFFGRDREARELLSLVVSERLVLFYAQSGAGKSSLIHARLIPQLEESGFAVLPVARLKGELPSGLTRPRNIFVFNLLLSLDQRPNDPHCFAEMSLAEFLTGLTSTDGQSYYYSDEALVEPDEEYEASPYVLIIDQFEELITSHPNYWLEREDFFRQLNEAMLADPNLWVVLALRADFVAALDPYAHLVTNNLRARFHLQRPTCDAALAAVQKPAELGGCPFAPGVAETLVDNLRQIKVPGWSEPQLGQFVEPVQLQVVCYQLWENLKGRAGSEITQADLPLDYVSRALMEFYEAVTRKVARQTGVAELTLRDWFESHLITEGNTRGTVHRGESKSGGLINEAADMLVGHYLLRTEMRAGGTWYELTHDRFIDPIRRSNAGWRLVRLKRWSHTSFGLTTFLIAGLIIAALFRFFTCRK